ncbi:hypothetical protein JYU23_00975 [bacterium AH-315-C07]|nr:hypothetical protein [bacterium AH-315-C07]
MTEFEIKALVQNPQILAKTEELQEKFANGVAKHLDLKPNDFLAVAFLTPSIDIAFANGDLSLGEEMDLNAKARKLSEGHYFLETDPVVFAMGFLIDSFEEWKDDFYDLIKLALDEACLNKMKDELEKANKNETLEEAILSAPYIFDRFLVSIFLNDDDDVLKPHEVSKDEYNKFLEISEVLDILHLPIVKRYIDRIEITE